MLVLNNHHIEALSKLYLQFAKQSEKTADEIALNPQQLVHDYNT
jgi:hypothetical protein